MANDRDCENCIHKINGACKVWVCEFEPMRGMTKEEAIEIIECGEISNRWGKDGEEVEKMAIEALKQEPCDKCVYSTSEGCQYDDITETIPPFETSDDAISRQAVLDAINTDFHEDLSQLEDAVKQLPPVNPQKPICPSAGIDCENCPAYEPKVLNKWIGAEVLDRIRNEMHATAEKHEDGVYYLRDEWIDEIIDKYAEGSDK